MADARFRDLILDANDPRALATFWATALGREVTDGGVGGFQLLPVGDVGATRMWVDPVPETRTAKTRVHLDARLGEPDPSALLAAGASVVREPGDDTPWWVLADPEGNEFCAFAPGSDTATPTAKT